MKRVASADVAWLIALAAIWGASFVFLRILAPALGPLWTASLRLLIAGAALVSFAALSRVDSRLGMHWRAYLFAGILNSAIPFVLYAFAALHLPASYMVVLNAAYPLFAALLAPFWLGEPLTGTKLLGLGTGVAGVALLSGAGPLSLDSGAAVAIVACLAATLCYAVAAIWLKRKGSTLSPIALAAWSQLLAGAALLPFATIGPLPRAWSVSIVANLLGLALMSSAAAYLIYYRLIRDMGPTRVSTVTLLMPGFGVAWAALFLDEAITPAMIVGLGLVVAGVAAVFRPARAPARAASTY